MIKPYHLMTPTERLKERIAVNREIEQRIADARTSSIRRPLQQVKVSFVGKDAVGFSHSDVFPVIASVVRGLCGPQNEYVGHRDIVTAMTKDAELSALLNQIVSKDPQHRDKEWWANSMMAWFSQTYTEDRNPYVSDFDRHHNARPYRYRLRQTQKS